MKNIILNIYHSPTVNTWFSYSTKALSLLIVIPLILKKFSVDEIALWYLFSTTIALQGIADMGFRFTFTRYVSYAFGGANDIPLKNVEQNNNIDSAPNYDFLGRIYAMMKYVYFALSILLLILLVSIGSLALKKQINLVENETEAWIAWGIIIITSTYKFYGSIYSNYLEGINKIALVRRVEGFMSILAIITSIIVLIFTNNLLYLVIANQIWVILNVVRNKLILKIIDNKQFTKIKINHPFDKILFKKTWGPAWKTGVSSIMSNSLTNFMTLFYAQIGNSVEIASYLLSLRLLNQVKDISVAPFYTKLPMFAIMFSKGQINEIRIKAQKSMMLSNLVFVVGSILTIELGGFLIDYLDSEVKLVGTNLWILLIFAFFIHRYGAMHINLYTIGNHVISHIADGISGVIFITTTAILLPTYDLLAIPIGMISGYLGFYAWYAGYHSYNFMKTNFLTFEKKANLIPFGIFITYTLLTLIFKQK